MRCRFGEFPGHAPGVQSDYDEDIERHATDEIENRHEQHAFLNYKRLQQHLNRQEQAQVTHCQNSEEGFLKKRKMENIVSEAEQYGNRRD